MPLPHYQCKSLLTANTRNNIFQLSTIFNIILKITNVYMHPTRNNITHNWQVIPKQHQDYVKYSQKNIYFLQYITSQVIKTTWHLLITRLSMVKYIYKQKSFLQAKKVNLITLRMHVVSKTDSVHWEKPAELINKHCLQHLWLTLLFFQRFLEHRHITQ